MAVGTYLPSVLEDLRGKGLPVPLAFPEDANDLDAVSFQSLLKGNVLTSIISGVAESMHTSNQLAAASLFQKRYANVLLVSVIHPLLYAGIGILADPEHTDVILKGGLPVGIRLRDPSQWMPVDVADSFLETDDKVVESSAILKAGQNFPSSDSSCCYGAETGNRSPRTMSSTYFFLSIFHTALDRNLKELIGRISSEIGVSPLILWENAGNYVRSLYRKIGNDRELRFPPQRVFRVLRLDRHLCSGACRHLSGRFDERTRSCNMCSFYLLFIKSERENPALQGWNKSERRTRKSFSPLARSTEFWYNRIEKCENTKNYYSSENSLN
jgi:ferric iron reductase protein FhuF